MTIDIVSLIIGAILWELVSNYVCRIIIPVVKRLFTGNNKAKKATNKHQMPRKNEVLKSEVIVQAETES